MLYVESNVILFVPTHLSTYLIGQRSEWDHEAMYYNIVKIIGLYCNN
jgi:hypothetical protein